MSDGGAHTDVTSIYVHCVTPCYTVLHKGVPRVRREEILYSSTLNVVVCYLFPGPAQLSVTCSTEKRGEPGIFSHMSMT